METFTVGERVRFVGEGYEEEGWTGREGTVTDHFCDYGDHRVGVQFDGTERVVELYEDNFEHVVDQYEYNIDLSDGTLFFNSWNEKPMTTEVLGYVQRLGGWPEDPDAKMVRRLKAGPVEDVK